MTARMGSVALILTSLLAAGCQNKLHDENLRFHQQNRELQSENDRLRTEMNARPDPAQLAAMQSEIAARDQKIAELQNQLRQPSGGQSGASLAGIETSYDDASGQMTVAVPGDVLFASGDAAVRDQARGTLDKVAASLKQDYAGKPIRIEGHTDSDPIKYSKWKSNQELSEARAEAVKSYLVKKGIDASLITTQGLGSQRPKGKDKAINRRVDIVVAVR